MFQVGRFPTHTYVFSVRSMILHHGGFPIRKSTDISLICSSPWLIAACHVLLRLLMPRHSPCALFRLNFPFSTVPWIAWVSWTFGYYLVKRFPFLLISFHLGEIVFLLPFLERPILISFLKLIFVLYICSFLLFSLFIRFSMSTGVCEANSVKKFSRSQRDLVSQVKPNFLIGSCADFTSLQFPY